MGIFSSNKSNIESDGIMKKLFPNFYKWMDDKKVYLKAELSVNNSMKIEFKMPITTHGNIMGYNYIGIENTNGNFCIYMNCVSRKGKEINGKKIQIQKDETFENYENLVKVMTSYLAGESDYLQIALGNM